MLLTHTHETFGRNSNLESSDGTRGELGPSPLYVGYFSETPLLFIKISPPIGYNFQIWALQLKLYSFPHL